MTETFAFSADISQLMSLIINTFYTNKDIFLRELISNSSDALDKSRYQSLINSTELVEHLEIKILCDKNANTITISDTGVGMTKEDMINNLGTIAKSGTKSFMEALKAGADISMIGQFGVGFYSSFLVADKVTVISKHKDDRQWKWESDAGGSFQISESDYDNIKIGTSIILNLKEDMGDFLEEETIKKLVKKHSEFVSYPILLFTEKTREIEVEDDEEVEDDVKVEVEETNKEKIFLTKNSKKDGVITLPSGLQYKILNKGDGQFHPTIDSKCSCHYEGTLIDGTVFDSSYERNTPSDFAPNQVIKGWTEAMQLMVEGDKFELYIPSTLAYGESGRPPKINGGATLIFKLELIEIKGEKIDISKNDEVKVEEVEEGEVEEGEVEEGEVEEGEVEEVEVEEGEVEEVEKKKKMKKITEKYNEWEHLNKLKPIWTRNSDDITEEEYNAFYKSITNDWDNPVDKIHFKVEGQIEFKSLLYIPNRILNANSQSKEAINNIKLYVRRVFIMDDSIKFIPEYLSFVHGIIDSDDMPLNISRETLQENKIIKVMKKQLVKKIIELFHNMAEDSEKYNSFFEKYGKNIKYGISVDKKNASKMHDLLRYKTTKSDEYITLDQYIENMQENQTIIYHITGQSIDLVKNSPFLEKLKKNNIECLYMTEPVDEYLLSVLKEYKGHKLISVFKDNFKIEGGDEGEDEKLENVCNFIKQTLGDKIKDVKISNKLIDTPCCLVIPIWGWSANMQRINNAQVLSNYDIPMKELSKMTLEINVKSPIIESLKQFVKAKNTESHVIDLVWLLYDTALIDAGYPLDSPHQFTRRIHHLVNFSMNEVNEDTENSELLKIGKKILNNNKEEAGEDMEDVD